MTLPTVTPETFAAIMKKSKSLYSSQKYEEAVDVIILIQEDVDNFKNLSSVQQLIFYNNVGVLYYHLNKPHLSSLYLNKAHDVYLQQMYWKNTPEGYMGDTRVIHPDIFLKVIYNKAVCMLFAKRPIEAFHFLKSVVQGMQRSAIVWLRLAECCILCYKMNNEAVFNFLEKRSLLVKGKIGSGALTKIVLNSRIYKDSAYRSEPQSSLGQVPSLGFASICLKNAYLLLPTGSSKLRQSVLAASSYVHLAIGSPAVALKYAKMLHTEASFYIYKYLGKLYLAESLLMMNQIEEAVEVLKPTQYNSWDNSDDLQVYKWFSSVTVTSQAVLYYNLAIALTIQGEYYKASELLRNVWRFKGMRNEVPIHIIALALYIELVLGHIDMAKIILKQNCPYFFQKN